jgi:hypothetical protein
MDGGFAGLMGLPEPSKGITFNKLSPKELEIKKDPRIQARRLCEGRTLSPTVLEESLSIK